MNAEDIEAIRVRAKALDARWNTGRQGAPPENHDGRLIAQCELGAGRALKICAAPARSDGTYVQFRVWVDAWPTKNGFGLKMQQLPTLVMALADAMNVLAEDEGAPPSADRGDTHGTRAPTGAAPANGANGSNETHGGGR